MVVPVVVVLTVVPVVEVVVVVVLVLVVVVVVVPAAYADAAPTAVRREPRTRNQTPRRICQVCRSWSAFAEFLRAKSDPVDAQRSYAIGTCERRLGSIRSRISVRLEPVAVIPWLRSPTTA